MGIQSVTSMTLSSLRQRAFLFVIFALFYMVIIGLEPLSEKVKTIPATGDGDLPRQLCYSLIFLTALVATQPVLHARRLLTLPVGITLALAYCWLSLSWSIAPSVGLRRLVLTSIIIFSIFRAVEEAGYPRSLAVVRLVLVITLFLNYISIPLTPAAIHQTVEAGDNSLVGDWRGVLPQKNFAGAVCALTILMFVFDARRINAMLRLVMILGSAYFLYRTHSKTSLGILLITIAVGAAYMRFNPSYRVLAIPVLTLLGAIMTLYINIYWDSVTAPLNDPNGLTGRVQIWPPLLAYANDHWLTGSGYGSFWNIGPNSPIYEYAQGWVTGVGNGHNGYIDMLTQLGFPGLAIIVVGVILIPFFRLLFSGTAPRARGALLFAMLVFCAGHNFTETSLFDRDMIVQLFLMFTVAMIGQVVRLPASAEGGRAPSRHRRPADAPRPALATRTHQP